VDIRPAAARRVLPARSCASTPRAADDRRPNAERRARSACTPDREGTAALDRVEPASTCTPPLRWPRFNRPARPQASGAVGCINRCCLSVHRLCWAPCPHPAPRSAPPPRHPRPITGGRPRPWRTLASCRTAPALCDGPVLATPQPVPEDPPPGHPPDVRLAVWPTLLRRLMMATTWGKSCQ